MNECYFEKGLWVLTSLRTESYMQKLLDEVIVG